MSYPGGWRPHIESALCLNLARLFAQGMLRARHETAGALEWTNTTTGEHIASIGYRAKLTADAGTLTLDYTECTGGERKAITCTLALVTRPCHYGGRRWYFVCPYTHRRALMLYKWGGIDWFCHREAVKPKPTYAIQRTSGSERINTQRWALRCKIGDIYSDLFGDPVKPKWMRWRTFNRYAARDAELSAQDAVYMARLLARMDVPGLG